MMDDSADTAALVHGLCNFNLLDAQTASNGNDPTSAALKLQNIKQRAAPALAGIDHVLDTLREVRICHIVAIPPPHAHSISQHIACPLLHFPATLQYVCSTLSKLFLYVTYMQVIGWPVRYANEAAALGVRWPRGVLLHGPSGTGKSAAVAAVAAEYNSIVHLVTAGSIVGAFVGESERRLRDIFTAADRDAEQSGRPVIIFLDDVDTLCPRRRPGQQHEARLVGQLLTLLDGAAAGAGREKKFKAPAAAQSSATDKATSITSSSTGHVVVIAATSRPNALDPALRRPGRLDREVAVPVPSPSARVDILRALTARLPIDPEHTDLELIASQCHGYTGADLEALCREAAIGVMSKNILAKYPLKPLVVPEDKEATTASTSIEKAEEKQGLEASFGATAEDDLFSEHDGALDLSPRKKEKSQTLPEKEEVSSLLINTEDFLGTMKRVGASVARTVVKEFPPAVWDDIGGLDDTKNRLKQAVEWPLTRAEAFKRLGIRSPRGVLLHGPPGCAKTTLARAAATSSGATFIPLQGSSLYSMFVGEGEAELREAFRKARLAAPAIIFVDELDMLVGKRGAGAGAAGTDDTSARLLSTFLNEMDGLELASGLLVLAATNRPDAIDTALLRPGRFDVALYVPPPDKLGRLAALRVHTRHMPLGADVDLEKVAGSTERYTGAELAAVCREAAMAALREDVKGAQEVAARHFEAAVAGVTPMLTEDVLKKYEAWPPRKKPSILGL